MDSKLARNKEKLLNTGRKTHTSSKLIKDTFTANEEHETSLQDQVLA